MNILNKKYMHKHTCTPSIDLCTCCKLYWFWSKILKIGFKSTNFVPIILKIWVLILVRIYWKQEFKSQVMVRQSDIPTVFESANIFYLYFINLSFQTFYFCIDINSRHDCFNFLVKCIFKTRMKYFYCRKMMVPLCSEIVKNL